MTVGADHRAVDTNPEQPTVAGIASVGGKLDRGWAGRVSSGFHDRVDSLGEIPDSRIG
jgi:hypothetical protein